MVLAILSQAGASVGDCPVEEGLPAHVV